ncbi:uncharacterized protein LOC134034698 isoform X2 [Osmerus eperlanus]|uniref:uncharacterized protein LOC134034698 isoform X2 n=1 Tax=Osmerus eperlanus TaxID=29151 RepID=UPI002E148989
MDTPLQFTGGPLPDLRVKQESMESPAPSCLSVKSDRSMDPPLQFTGGTLPDLRVKQETMDSPAPSCLSVKSEMSMDPPLQFRDGSLYDISASLLTEDQFRCSVCSEALREPVSIPCGHSYCRQCISTYWAQPSLEGYYVCPECSKRFCTLPELSINTALARVLQAFQQAGYSPALPAQTYAGAGDVPCDLCPGPKHRAVKSCLTCSASYCERHVRQHYTVPALQRHLLEEVRGDQTHTDQPDRTMKMEDLKEEETMEVQTEEETEKANSFSTCTQLWKIESERECSRVKQERMDSPAPSCLSVKSEMSMDPPLQFTGGTLLDLRVLKRRMESPAPSCLSVKRYRSMDPPLQFTGGPLPDLRVKQERMDSPAPSCLSVKSEMSMDPPLQFRDGSLYDISVKQESMESPAPSCLSVKSEMSMDPPLQFTGGTLPDLRVLKRRMESPAPSCLSVKSEMSMDPPLQFTGGPLPDLRVKQERMDSPAPSCLSVKSEMSMDPPLQFRDGSLYDISLLTEDQFRCSVCSQALMEPISIPCGHSYCRQCISTYWAQPSLEGYYVCPECSKRFSTLPELSINTALARVLQAFQQAGYSPALPAQTYAGAGDVPCDLCPGPKHRAVKSCLTCSASYCEGHVRQHYTVPALQRHLLAEVRGDQTHTDQPDRTIKMEDIKEGHEHKMEEGLDDESNSQGTAGMASQQPSGIGGVAVGGAAGAAGAQAGLGAVGTGPGAAPPHGRPGEAQADPAAGMLGGQGLAGRAMLEPQQSMGLGGAGAMQQPGVPQSQLPPQVQQQLQQQAGGGQQPWPPQQRQGMMGQMGHMTQQQQQQVAQQQLQQLQQQQLQQQLPQQPGQPQQQQAVAEVVQAG